MNARGNTSTFTNQVEPGHNEPVCPYCRDEKFVPLRDENGRLRYRRCQCLLKELKQKRVERLFASARIPRRFREKTFDNFAYEKQPYAFDTCQKYASNFNEMRRLGKSLFLVGAIGTGKSHLAFAILNSILSSGYAGMAVTVPDLLEELRPKNGGSGENEEKMRILKSVDFLVLDDLGAQKNSDWVTEKLFMLINARYAEMLPTVITSNNYLEELEAIPGWQRIVDRLIEMCEFIEFHGKSYRQQ